MNPAATPQPPPAEGGEMVLLEVINNLRERAEMGYAKYGTYLMTHNGRKPLWDGYQEILDFVMYLRQYLMEQEQYLDPTLMDPVKLLQRSLNGVTDKLIDYIAANEEWKKEVDAQLAYLSTNMAYMAAKQGAKPLRVLGYPRTEE